MIIGENSRPGDMDVNATKEKKLTNMRTHATDEALRLTPPRPMTLESAIEFIAVDELVEVTPSAIRLRKRSRSRPTTAAASAAARPTSRAPRRPSAKGMAERRSAEAPSRSASCPCDHRRRRGAHRPHRPARRADAAVPGGGPYNTARTIGRLGGDVAFLGRLSTDRFGARLRRGLEADQVDLGWTVSTAVPTTLAVAEVDDAGAATYRFYLSETSAPGLELGNVLAALRTGPDAVHVGTLGLMAEPIGSALAIGLESLDRLVARHGRPQLPAGVIRDRGGVPDRLRGILARADVVKVSADDLGYLEPEAAPEAGARALLAIGQAVVLLTDGARTVRVFAPGFAYDVPVPAVEVVDTVGSGDAFGGAFLAWLMESGGGRGGLHDAAVVRGAAERAIEVASLTCQRPGADPPRRDEVGWPART